MFPIQFGKTEVAVNAWATAWITTPARSWSPLPGEVSMHKWTAQLNPMIEECPAVRATLTSTDSRSRKQPARVQGLRRRPGSTSSTPAARPASNPPASGHSSSMRWTNCRQSDRRRRPPSKCSMVAPQPSRQPTSVSTSAPRRSAGYRASKPFTKSPTSAAARPRAPIAARSSPGMVRPSLGSGRHGGGLRLPRMRRPHLRTPQDRHDCCRPLGRQKPLAPKPARYHINALYCQIGLGPRWSTWSKCRRPERPARLKTFINDRLAEAWEDPAMRAVKHNIIADRAEAMPCASPRLAPWSPPPASTPRTTASPSTSSAGAAASPPGPLITSDSLATPPTTPCGRLWSNSSIRQSPASWAAASRSGLLHRRRRPTAPKPSRPSSATAGSAVPGHLRRRPQQRPVLSKGARCRTWTGRPLRQTGRPYPTRRHRRHQAPPLQPPLHRRRQDAGIAPRSFQRPGAARILRRPGLRIPTTPAETASKNVEPATSRWTPGSMPMPPPTIRNYLHRRSRSDWDQIEARLNVTRTGGAGPSARAPGAGEKPVQSAASTARHGE